MFFHGLARLPISDNEIYIFIFGILVKAVAQTTFFLTNSERNRTNTMNKFIRFARLDYELYLIVINASLQCFEKLSYFPSLGTSFWPAKAMPFGARTKDERNYLKIN